MEKIEAYMCSHCGKIYETSKKCRKHESRCYYNKSTKSCATCAFLKVECKKKPNVSGFVYVQFQACIVNENIAHGRLRTYCKKYLNKSYSDDTDIMNAVNESYNSEEQFNNSYGKINLNNI